MKKIIIGIPIYNGALTIEKTFASLRKAILYCNKRCPHQLEVVFVLNGCTDESESIVRDITQFNTDLTIRLHSIDKASKPLAINILRAYKADYIGYVDDDVILDEEAIMDEIRLLESNEDIWGVYVDSFPLPCREGIGWFSKIIYNAMTMRTRFNLLADRGVLLIGRCVLFKQEKLPLIPEDTLNEDQYLDYLLYPHIKKVNDSFIFYEGIYSLRKNFQRDIRITAGRKQLKKRFPNSITDIVDSGISRKINYNKLFSLSIGQIVLYIIYRIIYKISKVMVNVCLLFNNEPQWKRTS